MFNEYTTVENAKHHWNDLLREAEHHRLVRRALGARSDKPSFWLRSLLWQRRFWRKLLHIRRPSALSLLHRMQVWVSTSREAGSTPRAPTADAAPLVLMTHRGVAMSVRRVAPSDVAALQAFVGRLSERTRSLRYMTARPLIEEAARQEAHRMARGHTAEHVTLITTNQDSDDIIAVAELVRDADQPTIGEFALVVRDDAQNDGIGSELLWRLVQMAPQLGLAQLRANMLAENRPMRALIRKLGSPYTSTYDSGALEIVWQLTAHGARVRPARAMARQAGPIWLLPPDHARNSRR